MNLRRIILLLFILAVVAGPAAAENHGMATFRLAGNQQAAWLVKPDQQGKTFDIFRRELGGSWKPVVRQLTGFPTHTVAVGNSLHLIFRQQQYAVVNPDGNFRNFRNVPGKAIAVCEAVNFNGQEGPTLLAIVRRANPPENETAKPPAAAVAKLPADTKTKPTKPAKPAGKKPVKRIAGFDCLYQSIGGQWKAVTAWPVEKQVHPPLLAMTNGVLYKLSPMIGPPLVIWGFYRLDNLSAWNPVKTGTATYKSSKPIAILGFAKKLVLADLKFKIHKLVNKTDKGGGKSKSKSKTLLLPNIYLQTCDPKTNTISPPQPILRDGKNMVWPINALPKIARLNDQLAVTWSENGKLKFSLVNIATGEMDPAEDLSAALAAAPDKEKTARIVEYFLWGVTILMGIVMFGLRPRTGPKPFTLPEGVKPGNLPKRILAVILDYLPFHIIARAVFTLPIKMDEFMEIFKNPETLPPEGEVYVAMLSIGLFAIYGTIMELRYGATLGKMLMKLRVVSDGGMKPGLREIALRNLLKIIEFFLFAQVKWLVGVLILPLLITRNRQRFGDIFARTTVIDANSKPISSPAEGEDENNSATDEKDNPTTPPPVPSKNDQKD